MTRRDILNWLAERDASRLAELWRQADETRRRNVGDDVHLRGLIEFSNVCRRSCGYCGLRAPNTGLDRYRMSADEILDCVRQAVAFNYGTVVLQSGEDPGVTRDWLASVVRRIKAETPLAVTLSVGERSAEDLAAWRQAGADRYLLRFETSNRRLYDRIHPAMGAQPGQPGQPGRRSDRIAILGELRRLGYAVGSGVMIGIPGQTFNDLATDIETFERLDLDMIGVGPFLPHPDTPLAGELRNAARETPHEVPSSELRVPTGSQVPNTELMTYKVIALARLVCPRANIPATTALATLNLARGRELGLMRGANVIMPNLTPAKYRDRYEIYPSKACLRETAEEFRGCIQARVDAIGRQVGAGRGDARPARVPG